MLFGSICRPLMYIFRAMRGRPSLASSTASPRMDCMWEEFAFRALLYRSRALLVCCCCACGSRKELKLHQPVTVSHTTSALARGNL